MRSILVIVLILAAKGLVLKGLRDAARKSATQRAWQESLERSRQRPQTRTLLRAVPPSRSRQPQAPAPGRRGTW